MLTKIEVESLMDLMMVGGEITMDALYQQFAKKFSNEGHSLFRPCQLCLSLLSENVGIFRYYEIGNKSKLCLRETKYSREALKKQTKKDNQDYRGHANYQNFGVCLVVLWNTSQKGYFNIVFCLF